MIKEDPKYINDLKLWREIFASRIKHIDEQLKEYEEIQNEMHSMSEGNRKDK